jgi:SAM-dependent methyltransferase
MCAGCEALGRHRLFYLLCVEPSVRGLRARLQGASVLHFGPEPSLQRALARLAGRYYTADAQPGAAALTLDMTAIALPSECFDVVIANHVLEHIQDDLSAIREMHRMLRPGGIAIVSVPLCTGPTYENPALTDPRERQRLFEEQTHVGPWGDDHIQRLLEASRCASCRLTILARN